MSGPYSIAKLVLDSSGSPVIMSGSDQDEDISLLSAKRDPVTGGVRKIEAGGRDALADIGITAGLGCWKKKLATDPANAKLVLIGDSTSDYTTSSAGITNSLRNFHSQRGQALYGMVGDSDHIIAQGHNGISLEAWLADPAKLAALAATAGDLVIPSFGLNDVRLGQCSQSQFESRLVALVNAIASVLPNADILLRIPNPMLTTNVGGLNYVTDASNNINPAGVAQTYSTLLRNAYLAQIGKWSHVDVIDMQALVFGTVSRATHPLLADQLHPTPVGSTYGGTPLDGGYVEIAKAIAAHIGHKNAAFELDTNQYGSNRNTFFCTSGGNGYIDIASQDTKGLPAAQYPLTTADVLFVDGFAGPISLAGATIYRPFGVYNIRVSVTGDYTAAIGKRVAVAGNHPDATTQDRQIVALDLPSVAAGATAAITVAVTGARTGALPDATAVVATPPAAFVSAGLVLLNCYPSGTDSVTLAVLNPTGAPVDLASASFAFWVIR